MFKTSEQAQIQSNTAFLRGQETLTKNLCMIFVLKARGTIL